MQKRYLFALTIVAGIALLSPQQGPACPFQDAERSAAAAANTSGVSDDMSGGGTLLNLGRSAIFAP